MTDTTRGGRQRDEFLAGTVEHVLRNGVATLSLRPLATALGTSDRMLLYYFRSRDELLAAVLRAAGARLQETLEQALPAGPVPPAQLFDQMWTVLRAPDVEPHLRLYVEVAGLAVRDREPYRAAAAAVAGQWRDWLAARLTVPGPERAATAAGLLIVLDGLLLARFVAEPELAESAGRWLRAHLVR